MTSSQQCHSAMTKPTARESQKKSLNCETATTVPQEKKPLTQCPGAGRPELLRSTCKSWQCDLLAEQSPALADSLGNQAGDGPAPHVESADMWNYGIFCKHN